MQFESLVTSNEAFAGDDCLSEFCYLMVMRVSGVTGMRGHILLPSIVPSIQLLVCMPNVLSFVPQKPTNVPFLEI